jgi:hypothetical protein
MIARFAARSAFGLSLLKVGSGRVLYLSMNRRKMLPSSPKGPTAMGMNALLLSNISPITSSADNVRLVSGLVPPVLRANFIFSPSLKRNSVSLYRAASESEEEESVVE